MKTDIHEAKYHNPSRSEEVQDIIDRMPARAGKIVALIVLIIFMLLMIFGWGIRYPDILTGNIVINTPVSPVKLVANSSGQLSLNGIKSQSFVTKDDALAVIENGVSYDTIRMIKKILLSYNPVNDPDVEILNILPPKMSLGEVTNKYYVYLNSLHQLYNFNTDRIYDKQMTSLRSLNAEQQKEIEIGGTGITIAETNNRFVNKAFERDSFLFSNKVSAEAEFDKSKQALLNARTVKNNALSKYITARKEARQTQEKMVELTLQKQEKKRELEMSTLAAYNDLVDNLKLWEQKYLLKAPFDGHIQFLKFWTNKQFVQAGEPIFTIVPGLAAPYGQMVLPAFGAGKVKPGQEVIVKLNDYPYMEFGAIKGTVASVSLTTNTEKTKDAIMETYLVTVKLDKGLTTNYGQVLQFKHEATGSAEIVTKDRRLIERLFDNLKYSVKR